MKIIGITGPTGAGKTTALHALTALGAEVLDADLVYHQLLDTDEGLRTRLVRAFGPDILDEAGTVDRKRLSAAVYPDRLEELNGLTHPVIVDELFLRAELARQAGRPAVAIDAIARVESGIAQRCDVVVAVLAPLEVRIRRIMARDGIDEPYARRRALAQKGEDFFRAHADYVLENGEDDTPEAFARRCHALFAVLLTNQT